MILAVFGRLVLWAFTLSFVVVVMLAILRIDNAYPHDVYQGLYDPRGQLCCGGDPVTGDCEALTYDQVHVNVDGTASFQSQRYKHTVLVGARTITWLPVDDRPAHWCGRPRTTSGSGAAERPDDEQPDPSFWTYCAFIAPGGV